MRTPLLLFLLSSSVAWATVQPRGEFRGYTEVNRILKERVARANGFQLGKYLGESSAEPGSNGLLSLLGTYLGSDTDAAYRNGQPNSLNMLLWYLALSGLATAAVVMKHSPWDRFVRPAPRLRPPSALGAMWVPDVGGISRHQAAGARPDATLQTIVIGGQRRD
ncbi:MAG: hypothetical protein HY074_10800 [Deltaproteobacteria bacterium]|nr:hypothetical protein [Deltaproteobacteria bacterium]